MQRKLLFVTRNLSGGGAERVISNLANYFSTNGYDVTLICLDKGDNKYYIAPSVKIESLVERKYKENLIVRLYYALMTFIKLLRVIRKEKPYCTISFITSVNIWTGLCCFLLNTTYIVSERTAPHYSINKLNALSKWFAYKIYSKAKVVVLPSKRMLEKYHTIRHFRNLKNFATVYNPVNKFKSPSTNSVHPKNFILAVGRLNSNKRFEMTIDAFSELREYDVDLLISGIGPIKDTLVKHVAELGLSSRVQFIGFQENIQDYYSQATLYVSTSAVEGYPNSLVEALSFGCPAVATDCEFGPSEIIENGSNGFLIQLNDKEELVIAMERLLNDTELRSKFSNNAIKINETNSIDTIATHWNNLIQS
ncbi:MAG: glycosyltransferase [Sphingobacterium composti]|uniref:glycosyltransferase n=1 Tax=Sphingobacterium composti TaxID=363260 RepID=UPI00135A7871|nr:glycosyltransferase [Sphingobacterium composti Ten et al. 2007 non Yoo et al. 2007]